MIPADLRSACRRMSPKAVTLTARRDGLVPIRVYLRHSLVRETEMPRSYTLAMEPGTSIGGIVRDEAGQPIDGVSVTLYENKPDDDARQVYDFPAITARSDRQGRWQIDLIPDGFDLARLHFTFSHPEFLSSIDAINIQPIATPKELRDRAQCLCYAAESPSTAACLIAAAARLPGPRFDWEHDQPYSSTVKTDAFGRFHIGNCLPRETVVTAQAAGYCPEMQPLKVQPGLAPVELRLGLATRFADGSSIATAIRSPAQSSAHSSGGDIRHWSGGLRPTRMVGFAGTKRRATPF